MNQNLILLSLIGLLLSCSPADKQSTLAEEITQNEAVDSYENLSEREVLVKELERIQEIFASNDKEKIANLLNLPTSNENLNLFIFADGFDDQLEANNNQITKQMFFDYYSEISQNLQIEQMNPLFKAVNINNLLTEDNIEEDVFEKNEPCYHYYGVKIMNDLVTFTLGSNNNPDYKGKTDLDDENSFCEYVSFWVFIFDGKELKFKDIFAAG